MHYFYSLKIELVFILKEVISVKKGFSFFVVMILLSVNLYAFAFEAPQPPRWIWVDSTDIQGAWIDTQTLHFYKRNVYMHNNHRSVNYWVMYYYSQNNTHVMERVSMDFYCRTAKTLSETTYNDKNEVINFYDGAYSSYEDIIPNTFGEEEYYILSTM